MQTLESAISGFYLSSEHGTMNVEMEDDGDALM